MLAMPVTSAMRALLLRGGAAAGYGGGAPGIPESYEPVGVGAGRYPPSN